MSPLKSVPTSYHKYQVDGCDEWPSQSKKVDDGDS